MVSLSPLIVASQSPLQLAETLQASKEQDVAYSGDDKLALGYDCKTLLMKGEYTNGKYRYYPFGYNYPSFNGEPIVEPGVDRPAEVAPVAVGIDTQYTNAAAKEFQYKVQFLGTGVMDISVEEAVNIGDTLYFGFVSSNAHGNVVKKSIAADDEEYPHWQIGIALEKSTQAATIKVATCVPILVRE